MAQSVECMTLGFLSGRDLRVWDPAPRQALCSVRNLLELISLSLLSSPCLHMPTRSLSSKYDLNFYLIFPLWQSLSLPLWFFRFKYHILEGTGFCTNKVLLSGALASLENFGEKKLWKRLPNSKQHLRQNRTRKTYPVWGRTASSHLCPTCPPSMIFTINTWGKTEKPWLQQFPGDSWRWIQTVQRASTPKLLLNYLHLVQGMVTCLFTAISRPTVGQCDSKSEVNTRFSICQVRATTCFSLLFLNILFLYSWATQRQRQRHRQRSRLHTGSRCGTRSQDSKVMTWAEGRPSTPEPPIGPPPPVFFTAFTIKMIFTFFYDWKRSKEEYSWHENYMKFNFSCK